MNKRFILASGLTLLAASAVLINFGFRGGMTINGVSATQKTVLFDATHGLPEGGAGIYGESWTKYSYTTSVSGSDDIEVKAYCQNQQESYQGNVTIGGNHFLTHGNGNDKKMTFEVGLNNITNITVVYGHTNTTFLYLNVYLYDEDGIELGYVDDRSAETDQVVTAKQLDIDVATLGYESEVRSIKGVCYPWAGSTFTADVAYIDSVSLTWNC